MSRGKKTCPSCKKEVGPRTKICSCGHAFFSAQPQVDRTTFIKPKPMAKPVQVIKQKRKVRTPVINARKEIVQKDFNWRELKKGDEIRVLEGGPFWPREPEDGGNIEIGYRGVFTVKHLDDHGIHAYGKSEDNGHSYIFCGEPRKSNSGTMMVAHKIAKINKRIKDESSTNSNT